MSLAHCIVSRFPASLSCEIEPENPREQLYTVLWYKDDDGEPIYTYDARATDLLSPKHWSEQEPRGFGSRARLVIHPHPAQLVIEAVEAGDAGQYRCRVDFKSSQTRNSLVTLSIISPPTEARIKWAGEEVRGPAVGPVTQAEIEPGQSLICQAPTLLRSHWSRASCTERSF